ncbi:MAG: hypothetical protein J6I73_09990 [Treponema sp.]|nr:hypothetical protein [Treponema sp.]
MKRHSLLIFSACMCTLAAFISCKSAPQSTDVKPLDLLDDASAFYIKLPKKTDPVLVERILRSGVEGLDESDAKIIASHIDTIYTGIARSRRETTMQAAISGSVPKKIVQSLLKKHADWNQNEMKIEESGRKYFYYTSAVSDMQLAFPSNKIACVAKDVSPMLADFDSHSFAEDFSHRVSDAVYEWLGDAGSDIRFYAPNPLSFLTILTGANLNLQLNYVCGSMITDAQHDDQYIMSIEFDFYNTKVVNTGKAMLALAFGLTNSQVTQNSPANITVSGIKIRKQQLYKLFLL